MDIRLQEQLGQLGLQPNEAKIYLSLLELGRATVTDISQKAGLNRTTGYDILERLCLRGLSNRTGVGKKRMYLAEPPARLKQYLEDKKRVAERRLEQAGGVISDLLSLYKKESKPVITFFEGRDGIRNIYLHTLKAKSAIYSVLDLEQWLPGHEDFGEEYVKERLKLGIKEKILVQKNKPGLDFYNQVYAKNKRLKEITEYRWLEPKVGLSPATEINIYDDIVMGVLVKPGENVAFEVKSQSFANSLKIIFELAWQSAGKN